MMSKRSLNLVGSLCLAVSSRVMLPFRSDFTKVKLAPNLSTGNAKCLFYFMVERVIYEWDSFCDLYRGMNQAEAKATWYCNSKVSHSFSTAVSMTFLRLQLLTAPYKSRLGKLNLAIVYIALSKQKFWWTRSDSQSQSSEARLWSQCTNKWHSVRLWQINETTLMPDIHQSAKDHDYACHQHSGSHLSQLSFWSQGTDSYTDPAICHQYWCRLLQIQVFYKHWRG